MNRRNETRRAARAAAQVLASSSRNNRTSFDIVGAITARGIPLVFRPLDRIWGAFISSGNGTGGIIVNNHLGLAAQRFTLAHELGHLLLGHPSSLDETVGFQGRHASRSRAVEEVAADAFASELLASKHLVIECVERHGWNKDELRQPGNIYQLALRLGINYQAACWGLVTANILRRAEAEQLQAGPVMDLKRALAPEGLMANSWSDVWALTRSDTDSFLEAQPDDLFAVHLEDIASACYTWSLVEAGMDVEIVGELQAAHSDRVYGKPSARVVYVRFNAPGTHRLALEHTRQWTGAALDRIEIHIDDHGKERGGLPRRAKLDALARGA